MSRSEDGEMWAQYKEERQKKRDRNRAHSTRLLEENGISFESKSDGVHLIVNHRGKVIDFWPSTGLWCVRGSQAHTRGVNQLLSYLASL